MIKVYDGITYKCKGSQFDKQVFHSTGYLEVLHRRRYSLWSLLFCRIRCIFIITRNVKKDSVSSQHNKSKSSSGVTGNVTLATASELNSDHVLIGWVCTAQPRKQRSDCSWTRTSKNARLLLEHIFCLAFPFSYY